MKKILTIALVLCMLLSVCMTASAEDYKLEMRLSHVFSPGEALADYIQEAADSIREKTNGAIDIKVFPASQLDVYKDGVMHVVNGDKFISVEDPSYIGDYVPDFNVLAGPMMTSNIKEYQYLLQTDTVKDMVKKLEDNNIKVLALDYFFGYRFMKTNKEIYTPDDLKGMKIRVPMSQMYADTLNAMGANAVPMGWAETLNAVSSGVVDGLEGSMDDFLNDGSGEVASVGSLTNHLIGTCGVYFPLNVWNEIPEEYQTIIQDEFSASAQHMVDKIESSYEETKAKLEETGHTFNEVDHDAFAAAVAPLYEKMVENGATPGLYEKFREELANMPK
ncbi:MAG: C4-dicarboxylate TRAP transporter substrate-binding protein [Clostridia bacterium]|nr:C4-dicarboxylate TRAP transporter substrate-binding protein [Clostridia bacterium]